MLMRLIPFLVILGLLTVSSSVDAALKQPKDLMPVDFNNTGEGGYPLEIESKVVPGYKFHLVSSAAYHMGSDDGDADEQPGHSVSLSTPVYVGVAPVSNTQYEALVTDHTEKGNYSKGADQPVTQITFGEAGDFATKVQTQAQTQFGSQAAYFLPTEAIWEKAARENGDSKYPWGTDLSDDDKKYYDKSTAKSVTETLRDTTFHHMVGNVFCWCSDWYDKDYYKTSPPFDPPGASSGKTRSLRGGKWFTYEKSFRCADRWNTFPGTKSDYIGVRICRDLQGFN
jgi:formylglycine-generating enzyme required for sulfatase activity